MTGRRILKSAGVALALVLLISLGVAPTLQSAFAATNLTMELTIADVTFDSSTGTITVMGTVTCSEFAPLAQVTGVVTQPDGISVVHDANATIIISECRGATPFSMLIVAAKDSFHAGPAMLAAVAVGCDRLIPRPGSTVCVADQAVRILLITP